MRWLILAFAAIPALAAWATLAYLGTARGWWQEELAPAGDRAAMVAALAREIEARNNGVAVLQMLNAGRPGATHFASVGEAVSIDSQFQMASVSKWLSAWGVMVLVEDGRLDLDAPVSGYLRRWQLPASPFDTDQVTARRLLSHTAGLTDDLGYLGFAPDEPLQTLEAALSEAADALPGADGRVRVGMEPGAQWRYSGGGYALLQLLIEELSGQPFAAFMEERVLAPLGMHDSSFAGGGERLVPSYDVDGTPVPYRQFAAPAAAGLVSSAADLARFVAAQLPGPEGAAAGRGVLSPATVASMREPHAEVMGTPVWGLGQVLYAGNGRGGFVVGHDGSNAPAINTSVRVDPATGDAIILLVTGHRTLASELGGAWVLWHTGTMDVATFYAGIGDLVRRIALGWVVIAALVVVIGWRVNRGRHDRQLRTTHGDGT